MAKTTWVIKNPFVELDGTDYSAQVKSVEISFDKDNLDTTSSGDGGHTAMHGLEKSSYVFNLYDDKDVSGLDEYLFAKWSGEDTIVVGVAKRGSTISAANPLWGGVTKLFAYKPLTGDVGTTAMLGFTLEVQGGITRQET